MGLHEWAYDSEVVTDFRYTVPLAEKEKALSSRKLEVELGFSPLQGYKEAQRCLNCDVQTVFHDDKCIECDACMDICPTSCITFTQNEEEDELRKLLRAPANNHTQDLYV
jgi:ferredoxin